MSAIHLLPLGDVSNDLIESVRPPLRATFRMPVDVRAFSLDLERFYDEGRGQYNSTEILLDIKRRYDGIADSSGVKALAVVPYDLFIPILTYVFGEAEVRGSVAVVSPYRLAPERYGLDPDVTLFKVRFLKEVLHELGHANGLIHCSSQKCVMHSSSYVEDIDLKGHRFCDVCAELLSLH